MSGTPVLSFRAFARPVVSGDSGLTSWENDLRRSANPQDPIEESLVDRLVRAAHRLRVAEELPKDANPTDRDWLRALTEAERSWTRALTDWTRYHKAGKSLKPVSKPAPSPEPPATPSHPEPEPFTPPATPVSWPAHVTLDPSVSPDRLILKGTNLLVEHVAALLKEGYTPEQIHKDYPNINSTQIEAARLCDSAGCSINRPEFPPNLGLTSSTLPQPLVEPGA